MFFPFFFPLKCPSCEAKQNPQNSPFLPIKNHSMTDQQGTQDPKPTKNLPQSSSEKVPIGSSSSGFSSGSKYPNPPDLTNPDPATLREQWKFAIRQYSRWYSHAWGTAILAGLSFFALGWVIKGSNPLPSFKAEKPEKNGNKNGPQEEAKQG